MVPATYFTGSANIRIMKGINKIPPPRPTVALAAEVNIEMRKISR